MNVTSKSQIDAGPLVDLDLQVALANSSDAIVPTHSLVTMWANSALAVANDSVDESITLELSVRIVDADEMQQMNSEYRGKDKATNVLSFPMQLDPQIAQDLGVQTMGDIAICHSVVEDEATKQNKTILDHYAHMVVHGVMHLAGYDHQQEDEAKIMEALEVEALKLCKVANPYVEK